MIITLLVEGNAKGAPIQQTLKSVAIFAGLDGCAPVASRGRATMSRPTMFNFQCSASLQWTAFNIQQA
jgi:hypothetical protein